MNHGAPSAYNSGCRCEQCRAWKSRHCKTYRVATTRGRQRVVSLLLDATQVREHLAALRESGWTGAALSRETGVSQSAISELATGRNRLVRAATARILLDVPMLEPVDIDDVVVQRLVEAYPSTVWRDLGANRAERITAAEILDARGRGLRVHLAGRGFGDQQTNVPSRSEIERCLGLRNGRDFALRQQVAS